MLADRDHGVAFVPEGSGRLEDGVRPGRIEPRRRLVQHEYVWVENQDARERDPLELAARERVEVSIDEVFDPDRRQRRCYPRPERIPVDAPLFESERDLIAHGRRRAGQLVVRVLEDVPDGLAEVGDGRTADVDPCDPYRAVE